MGSVQELIGTLAHSLMDLFCKECLLYRSTRYHRLYWVVSYTKYSKDLLIDWVGKVSPPWRPEV